MKRIEAFQTADGVVHLSQRAAIKHADERYGAEVTRHARALAHTGGKFKGCMDYIEANVEALAALAALKRDRDTLESDDE